MIRDIKNRTGTTNPDHHDRHLENIFIFLDLNISAFTILKIATIIPIIRDYKIYNNYAYY